MHTITFFATKGGTSRTISTMALASGFLALGKRVGKAEPLSTFSFPKKVMSA